MVRYGYLLPTRAAVQSSETAAGLAARAESDVVGLARRAEALGLDAVWVGDSVLAKPRFEPLTTLAAVATATDAVDLGTAVYLPALRHPIHVAHATATVDRLSGGRLALGVGVGVRPAERREHEQLGVPFGRRGALVNEALAVASRLWAGETVTHEGEFFALDGAALGIPTRAPPVYVASAAVDPASGFPPTIRERLGRFAAGWLPIAVEPDEYAAGLERARGALADAGRDPGELDPAYYVDVALADSERAAREEARAFYRSYYDRDGPAYGDDGSEELDRRGAFGPPERVRERLAAYEEAGVETFVVRFAAPDQREQLRRFARLVERR